MKKTISLLAIFTYLAANTAIASMAQSFVCNNSAGTKMLFFVPEEKESLAQRCLYIDERNSWQHQEINAQGDFYTVTLKPGFEPRGTINSEDLASIEFWLPHDRLLKSFQSGGYYFPIMTPVPFEFRTMVFGKSSAGEIVLREMLSCRGS